MNYRPITFESWIGGFVGPSYELEYSDGALIYRVYERGYDIHKSEVLAPDDTAWRRFMEAVTVADIWGWEETYQGQSSSESTTWFINLETERHRVISKGINTYPPSFTDYLRAVRTLIEGRQFA